MKLSAALLALVAVVACAAAPQPPKRPWKIAVDTSGGLTGKGMGSFAVTSDGTVTAGACSFSLTADELRKVETLLAETRRRNWKASYAPKNECCDRYSYTLSVDEAGIVSQTRWISSPLPMPKDLVALSDAIIDPERGIRKLAGERCK